MGDFLPVNSGSWPDGSATGLPGALEYDHINHIFSKTGLRDRGQLVGYAFRHGLAAPD